MNKKIVIVSSGQPFGNPRMVKEAVAFVNQGATVHVIYSALNTEHIKFDEIIKSKNNNIIWKNVGYGIETGLLKKYVVKFRRKFWIGFYRLFGNVFNAAIKSLVPFSQELAYSAYSQKADVYIGHNIGALFAVVNAAKKKQS